MHAVHDPNIVAVKDPPYNAEGDGQKDDRAAIQSAIDAIITAGRGTVRIGPGIYSLRSYTDNTRHFILVAGKVDRKQRSITIQCEAGAVLVTSLGTSSDNALLAIQGSIADSTVDGCTFINTHAITPRVTAGITMAGGNPNQIHGMRITNNTFHNFSRTIAGGGDQIVIDKNRILLDQGRDSCNTGLTPCVGIWAFTNGQDIASDWIVTNNFYDGAYSGDVSNTTQKMAGDGFVFGNSQGWMITNNMIRHHGVEAIQINRRNPQDNSQFQLYAAAGSMTAGDKTLTVQRAKFSNVDLGRPVSVTNAGDSHMVNLYTSIVAVASSNVVAVADAAVKAVSNVDVLVEPLPFPVLISGNTIDSTPVKGTDPEKDIRYGIRVDEDKAVIVNNSIINAKVGFLAFAYEAANIPALHNIPRQRGLKIENNYFNMGSGSLVSDVGISVAGALNLHIANNVIEWAGPPAASIQAAKDKTGIKGIALAFVQNGWIKGNDVSVGNRGNSPVTAISYQQSENLSFTGNRLQGDLCVQANVTASPAVFEPDNRFDCASVIDPRRIWPHGQFGETTFRRQVVAFTPPAGKTGWYRIYSGGSAERLTGKLTILGAYDDRYTDLEAHIDYAGQGIGSAITQRHFVSYNGGLITEIRAGSDDGTGVYLDFYLASAKSPSPIKLMWETEQQGAIIQQPFFAPAGMPRAIATLTPSAPLNKIVTTKGSHGKNCTLTISNGIIIATTCP